MDFQFFVQSSAAGLLRCRYETAISFCVRIVFFCLLLLVKNFCPQAWCKLIQQLTASLRISSVISLIFEKTSLMTNLHQVDKPINKQTNRLKTRVKALMLLTQNQGYALTGFTLKLCNLTLDIFPDFVFSY